MKPRQDDHGICERAAQWLGELEEGGAQEKAAFAAWLKESPRHVEEFLYATALSREFNGFEPERTSLPPSCVVPLDMTDDSRATRSAARRYRRGAMAAAVAGVGAAIAWWVLAGIGWTTYATATGEQRAFELPDGSLLHLNTASRMRVRVSDTSREVRMESGEALFKVVTDARRPFSVEAGNTRIRVLGTQFNVYLRNRDTQVAVLDGKVSVVNGRADALLQAGRSLRVTADGSMTPPAEFDAAVVTAWRQRRLIFRTEQLDVIAAEFNRYNRSARIVIPEAHVRTRKLSGVFDADDPESLVQFLTRDGELRVEARDGELLIRHR